MFLTFAEEMFSNWTSLSFNFRKYFSETWKRELKCWSPALHFRQNCKCTRWHMFNRGGWVRVLHNLSICTSSCCIHSGLRGSCAERDAQGRIFKSTQTLQAGRARIRGNKKKTSSSSATFLWNWGLKGNMEPFSNSNTERALQMELEGPVKRAADSLV